jgi:hypothetical protein
MKRAVFNHYLLLNMYADFAGSDSCLFVRKGCPMKKTAMLSAATMALLCFTATVPAAMIVDFSFDEYDVDGSNAPIPPGANQTFTDTDSILPNLLASVTGANLGPGNNGSYNNELNAQGWNLTNPGTLTITLQPVLGFQLIDLDVDGVTLNVVRNGTAAPNTLGISDSFVDRTTVPLATITPLDIRSGAMGAMPPYSTEDHRRTFVLTSVGAVQNLTGPVTLTIYLPSSITGGGNLRINDLYIDGSADVAAIIPEPAGFALSAGIAFCISFVVRRRSL